MNFSRHSSSSSCASASIRAGRSHRDCLNAFKQHQYSSELLSDEDAWKDKTADGDWDDDDAWQSPVAFNASVGVSTKASSVAFPRITPPPTHGANLVRVWSSVEGV